MITVYVDNQKINFDSKTFQLYLMHILETTLLN
jgi:hypothetical protein